MSDRFDHPSRRVNDAQVYVSGSAGMSEPRMVPYTERDIATLRRIAVEQNSQTVQGAIDRRWLATLDEAREQAAAEARRELLAKVEGLPCLLSNQVGCEADGSHHWDSAAVIALLDPSR